ncbi:MAG: DUF397 domain-containing protein [Nocardiopsis sp. BM-2018]|nr:MAG: DUF397 domain-containing protein [Nocardiopsis sp. BM-2018]
MGDTEFHKSSYSSSGGNCVDVREGQDTLVRDTQNRGAATLSFTSAECRALLMAEARWPSSAEPSAPRPHRRRAHTLLEWGPPSTRLG